VRVWIKTNKERTHRSVEITDQGPGIPEADRERVFERFVRLDHSRNRIEQNQMQQSQIQRSQSQRDPSLAANPGGAGLGLAIARSIVHAHGGTLSFHSGPNGRGTTARVELPIGIPAGLQQADSRVAVPIEQNLKTLP
jgi:signal transduction histidine kinase